MAHSCREGVDKQYKHLQTSLKSVRQQLGSLVTRSKTDQEPTITLLEDSEGKEVEIESMTPTEKATLIQGVLDYTKQLSEKVFVAFQTVSSAATFLPHNLKSGATQAFTYSQELYTTLKSVSPISMMYNPLVMYTSDDVMFLWHRLRYPLTFQLVFCTGPRKWLKLSSDT